MLQLFFSLFQIEIKGNSTYINHTAAADQRDLTLALPLANSTGKNLDQQLTVQILAKNQMGPGPKSGNVKVTEYQVSMS